MYFHDIPLVYASHGHSPCSLSFHGIQRSKRSHNFYIPGASVRDKRIDLAAHGVDKCGSEARGLKVKQRKVQEQLHQHGNENIKNEIKRERLDSVVVRKHHHLEKLPLGNTHV